MQDLRARLRRETRPLHERLDALPYFGALHAGTLPKEAIVSFLRCLSIVHAVVERALLQTSDPRVRELGRRVGPKLPLLVADLDTLGLQAVPSITPAIERALDYASNILREGDTALSLVGILYVLEGSQNGGAVLKSAYARCLGVDPSRLSYVGCHTSAEPWRTFVHSLDALALHEEDQVLVARSAVICFEWANSVCAALYPYSGETLQHHVAGINPEAGRHVMPQNPLEISLALRAGQRAWDTYPYLEHRFGERGKRFTRSDSCWLVALTHLPVAVATRSLNWLRTVLAPRGLPTVILEGHLRAIEREMSVEFGEHSGERRYGPFLATLEEERLTRGGQPLLDAIGRFEERLRVSSGFKIDSAAQLVASAWLDERAGVRGAQAATQSWFVDPTRFSQEWIALIDGFTAELEALSKAAC